MLDDMADPIFLCASIIVTAAVAIDVSRAVKWTKDVKNSRKDIENLEKEVCQLRWVREIDIPLLFIIGHRLTH